MPINARISCLTPDVAYANADFIPNAASFVPHWTHLAQEFRAHVKNLHPKTLHLGLPYGSGMRQALDLFLPETPPRGVMVFVHGGYWRAFGRSEWSHLAAGALAQGWAVAMPSYTLAPEARISQITLEVATAIERTAEEVAGPIALVGHSAGGHLVARMNCGDVALCCADRVQRIVAISPLGDLRPLLQVSWNADLRLNAAEAVLESPTLALDRRHIPTTVWVGAQERPTFLDQARNLAEAWDEAQLRVAPGRHHFDVIAPLVDPDSPLVRAALR